MVDTAVQKDLSARYGTAEEFRTELMAAAQAEGLL